MSNITIDPYRFGLPACVLYGCTTKAWLFNGVNQYISIADAGSNDDFTFSAANSGADVNLAHSVAFWVKKDVANSNDAIYSKGSSTGNIEYRIFWVNDDIYCDTYNASGVGGYKRKRFFNTGLSNNTWMHVVLTCGTELGEWTCYINGTSLAGSSLQGGGGDMVDQDTAFNIGYMPQSGNWYADGKMIHFMLWKDHELTQAEVDYIYSSGTNIINPTVDCQGYEISSKLKLWLAQGSYTGTGDYSASSHTLILNNSITHDTSGDTPC